MYDNLEYAQKRLNKTIVRDKMGEVFYVDTVVAGEKKEYICMGYYPNPDGSFTAHSLPLSNLDLTPVPLGYVNYLKRGYCGWSCRIPLRQCWRQGLMKDNFNVNSHMGERMDWPDLTSLSNTINNKYPTMKEAEERIKKEKTFSVAFSRNFALDKRGLFYKALHVGENTKSLFKNYQYLREHLDEVLYNENFR